MDIFDLALDSNDKDWFNELGKNITIDIVDIIDSEVEIILPQINNMDAFQLEVNFDTMIYAINNSKKYSYDYLREKFKEMKMRHYKLVKLGEKVWIF